MRKNDAMGQEEEENEINLNFDFSSDVLSLVK